MFYLEFYTQSNMRKNEDTVSHTVTPKKKKIAFHMTFLKELPEDVLQ